MLNNHILLWRKQKIVRNDVSPHHFLIDGANLFQRSLDKSEIPCQEKVKSQKQTHYNEKSDNMNIFCAWRWLPAASQKRSQQERRKWTFLHKRVFSYFRYHHNFVLPSSSSYSYTPFVTSSHHNWRVRGTFPFLLQPAGRQTGGWSARLTWCGDQVEIFMLV